MASGLCFLAMRRNKAAAGGPDVDDGFVCVATGVRPLGRAAGSRLHTRLDGRGITILRKELDAAPVAMDSVCYHAGGPLTAGDIEDVVVQGSEGRGSRMVKCVVCPWHGYKISLETGEGFYQEVVGAPMRSKGRRQRMHEVQERSTGIFVKLDKSTESLPSDDYALQELAIFK